VHMRGRMPAFGTPQESCGISKCLPRMAPLTLLAWCFQARFVESDLECVANLIGLQSITSVREHEGSRRLFLFEQLTHLDRCSLVAYSFVAESNRAHPL
jgi:hypothetical protein